MDKKSLRNAIRAQKRAMTEEEITAASEALVNAFLATDAYKQAKTVYAYLPYNQEVRTVPLVLQAWKDGKQVAVPKIYGEEMRFLYITDMAQVAPGYSGIPEPIEDGPVAEDPTALVLMPGLAFDKEGHRIGYGGGYYDRFLAQEPDHPTIALCYAFQVVPEIPTADFDIPVDQVIWA